MKDDEQLEKEADDIKDYFSTDEWTIADWLKNFKLDKKGCYVDEALARLGIEEADDIPSAEIDEIDDYYKEQQEAENKKTNLHPEKSNNS